MSTPSIRTGAFTLALVGVVGCVRQEVRAQNLTLSFRESLESIRKKHGLPAMAAAVVLSGKTVAVDAVGVRKHGGKEPVTVDDKFHIGSDTKAMTATLLATFVEQGKLKWETTLAEVFPDWAAEMNPAYRKVTVEQLLTNRGGFPGRTEPAGKTLLDVHRLPGMVRERRTAYIRMIWRGEPEATPGTRFIYSNAGYTVAGAIAEKIADAPYEELIQSRVFVPLGIKSAGFGAMGTPGKDDQPWQHRVTNGKIQAIGPGPFSDNPPAIAPAGTVHCSIGDWAKFVDAHARGEKAGGILKPETFRRLHTPPAGGDYAMGWGTAERGWGGGRVLTHAGSNTMNYAVAWVAPRKEFAVCVATNVGGDGAARACDEVAAASIQRFLTTK